MEKMKTLIVHIGKGDVQIAFSGSTLCGKWAPLHLIRLNPTIPTGTEDHGYATLCPDCARIQGEG